MPGRKVSLPSTKLSLPSTSKMSLDARFTRMAYSPYQKLCGQTGRAGIMKEDPRSWSQQTSPSRMKSSVEVREGEVRGMLPVRSWEPRVQAFESDHGLALRRTSENQSQLGLQLRRLSRLEATQEAARVRNSRNRRLLPTVASSTSQCQSRQRPPVLRWGVRQPARTRFWVPGGIRPVNSGLLLPKRKSSVLCDCNRDCECDKKARDLLDCDLEAYMAGRKRDNSLNKIKDSHLNGVKDSPLDKIKDSSLDKIKDSPLDKIKDSSLDKIKGSPLDKIKDSSLDKIKDSSLDKIKDSYLNGVKDSPLDRLRAKRLKEMEEGEMEDA